MTGGTPPSHIRAITLDNASVNTKMLTILEDSLTGFTVQDGQVRCMAHVINLAAQQILSHLNVVPSEDDNDETNTSGSMKSIPIAFTRARNIIRKIRGQISCGNVLKRKLL